MSNVITAYFKGRTGVAEAVYQNDYGMIMAFDGIYLPAHFDCYFSVSGSEEAIPGIGAGNRVAIPNAVLAVPGKVEIHIPMHTGENDSEVEYVVYFKVINRSRPVDDGTPVQMTAIEQALALLQNPIGNIEAIVEEALSFTGETFEEMQEDLTEWKGGVEEGLDTWKDGVEDGIDTFETQVMTMVGTPLVAGTVAGMTDHSKIYVYTGSETGYTAGNWYYWNGSAWTSGGTYNSTAFTTDTTLTASGAAADSKTVGDKVSALKEDYASISSGTRNISTKTIGNYAYDSNDHIISPTSNLYFGMNSFIPVNPSTKYTIVFYGLTSSNSIYLNVIYKKSGGTYEQQGYGNINPRTVTTPANTEALYVYANSSSAITSTNARLQINEGDQSPYISPVSATDRILREDFEHRPIKTFTRIAPMVDTAEGYFEKAYSNDVEPLIHEAGYGLFYKYVKDQNDKNAIQCSEFVEALYKGITWNNSRYEKNINSLKQWGFTSDGIEQHEQDGEPYARSYYEIVNAPDYFDSNDKASHDYMLASELFRYAYNHGYGYEITNVRAQVRPGDFVFYVEPSEQNNYFRHITHVALVVFVGYDNNRVIVLESNTFSYGDNPNVGVGVGDISLQYYKYGARFPVDNGESSYRIKEAKDFSASGTNVGTWTTHQIFSDYIYPKGFYTIEVEGEFQDTDKIFIGVYRGSYDYRKVVVNGNKSKYFFYSPVGFQYVNIGFDVGNTYKIQKVVLYSGYKPD